MNNDFSRILALLRKERGIPQKQAAADLGVSQALLSHYENGIRECGLDFVVRAADYYGVSCDYLLGRTPTPGAAQKIESNIPEESCKSILLKSVRMLLSISERIGNDTLTRQIEEYLAASVYRMFRRIYRVYPHNEEALFTISEPRAELKSRCRMEETVAETEILAKDLCGEKVLSSAERKRAALTTEVLASDYGEDGTAMLRLIRIEEENLRKN